MKIKVKRGSTIKKQKRVRAHNMPFFILKTPYVVFLTECIFYRPTVYISVFGVFCICEHFVNFIKPKLFFHQYKKINAAVFF